MLVEDTAAFIEQLEVLEADRRAKKRRRRLARAEVEVTRAELEARVADDALRRLARDLVVARELEDAHGERAIVRELTMVRGRLRVARHKLHESRGRLQRLQRRRVRPRRRWTQSEGLPPPLGAAPPRVLGAAVRAALDVAGRPARPRGEARRPPLVVVPRSLLVGRRGALAAGMSRRSSVTHDLQQHRQADDRARARAGVLGLEPAIPREDDVSPIVRFAVWCRDRGRCVDCRSTADLEYDQIFPFSKGGLRWIANVELRCAGCRERRMVNTARTQVSRARIESTAFRR